ncbi:hypothetical protein BSKO_12248 [Bryopsis sp. KO-2023]|nr:hypothetical protein BSKO_12248 [Bryopsis sp. KO-2023]
MSVWSDAASDPSGILDVLDDLGECDLGTADTFSLAEFYPTENSVMIFNSSPYYNSDDGACQLLKKPEQDGKVKTEYHGACSFRVYSKRLQNGSEEFIDKLTHDRSTVEKPGQIPHDVRKQIYKPGEGRKQTKSSPPEQCITEPVRILKCRHDSKKDQTMKRNRPQLKRKPATVGTGTRGANPSPRIIPVAMIQGVRSGIPVALAGPPCLPPGRPIHCHMGEEIQARKKSRPNLDLTIIGTHKPTTRETNPTQHPDFNPGNVFPPYGVWMQPRIAMVGRSATSTAPRLVVHMKQLEDGYKWRKYGQKDIKGSANPRSYYKCTFMGCTCRKQVEKSAEDADCWTVAYEGGHTHPPIDQPIQGQPNLLLNLEK